MTDNDTVLQNVRAAFGDNPYPGDNFLQGSFEGYEPYEVIEPFKGQTDWQQIDAVLLDSHAEALSFFSQAALRFFLPAYLIADLQDELQTAEPLFTLTHGFSDQSVEIPTQAGPIVRNIGKSAFVNPKRYGATTFYDYTRWRLSSFTREEAEAIVTYLQFKKNSDTDHLHDEQIDAALDLFWLDRAANAPSAEDLQQHLQTEKIFLAAITPDVDQ